MSAALPLTGCRVVVTRARAQAGSLRAVLEAHGAEVLELPAIAVAPADPAALDAALQRLDTYQWLVLTSVNGADALLARASVLGVSPKAFVHLRVAAIGPATARRLQEAGLRVELVPERYVAESLLEAMVARGVAGQRVLLPRAARARDVLPKGLRAAGATVDVVVAYQTHEAPGADAALVERLRAGQADVLTLASPSAARGVAALLGEVRGRIPAVCIGPVTAAAARELGFEVAAVATEHSIPGLVDAVVALVRARREVEDAHVGQR